MFIEWRVEIFKKLQDKDKDQKERKRRLLFCSLQLYKEINGKILRLIRTDNCFSFPLFHVIESLKKRFILIKLINFLRWFCKTRFFRCLCHTLEIFQKALHSHRKKKELRVKNYLWFGIYAIAKYFKKYAATEAVWKNLTPEGKKKLLFLRAKLGNNKSEPSETKSYKKT
ncbi:hypothetical protein BpHYR1_050174 [Brachionus plicatilis]|uniref:Uncharacterized protein n=1 Tax=Brachionus plicatilis TaxID=10195 RepID=A0A3M7S0K9_BRAPC|nr:hypothetical protein BpHYR1_050174 [Brachionus plicatilis]